MSFSAKQRQDFNKLFSKMVQRHGFRSETLPEDVWAHLSGIADDVSIYVSPTGNDANPGTEAFPVLTFKKAFSLVPVSWRAACRIYFAPGVYPPTAEYHTVFSGIGKPEGPNAEPLTLVGGFTNEVGDRTSTAVTSPAAATVTEITDGSLAMTVNAYRGATLLVLTGEAAGQRVLVRSNTATKLVLAYPLFSNLAYMGQSAGAGFVVGDQFRVERPAATIDIGGNFFQFNGIGYLGMLGMKFKLAGPVGTLWFNEGTTVLAEGCEFDLGNTLPFGGLQIGTGAGVCAVSAYPHWGMMNPNSPASVLRLAAGCYVHDGQVSLAEKALFFSLFLVFKNVLVETMPSFAPVFPGGPQFPPPADCQLQFNSPAFFDSTINARGSVHLRIVGIADHPGIIVGSQPASPAILVTKRSYGEISLVDISSSNGDAIKASKGSYVEVASVTGSLNAGFGINVGSMSQASVDSPGVGTTVTGTGGDTTVGASVTAYGALPFSEAGATLNRIE